MREILFRGKRIGNGEWGYGDIIHRRYYKNTDVVVIRTEDSGFDNYSDYEVDPETVGQYTGLTDKNGREIFEGDIVYLLDITVGEIILECGAFGIVFRKQIDYDYLASEIAPITGCNNTPLFCYNDNFVSLWELYWNYNEENDNISVIEVIGNIYDDNLEELANGR